MDPINVCKYLGGGSEEEAARLFSIVPTEKARSNEYKLKPLKFHLNTQNLFFSLCGRLNTGESVAQKRCEVSGDTENPNGHSPEQPAFTGHA